jgi:predicted amidohydrolase YtcJ
MDPCYTCASRTFAIACSTSSIDLMEKISVAEAIEAYTLSLAYAAFQQKDRSSLEVGKLADFVVLSRDILADSERDRIADTHVLISIVGGKIV